MTQWQEMEHRLWETVTGSVGKGVTWSEVEWDVQMPRHMYTVTCASKRRNFFLGMVRRMP